MCAACVCDRGFRAVFLEQRTLPGNWDSLNVWLIAALAPQAAQFVRGPGFVSAAATTASSGIGALLVGAAIDDYVFEPCGYSMNALDGAAFTTIHVTPEEDFSYASVELCGYAAAALDAGPVVAQARPAAALCLCLEPLGLVLMTSTVQKLQPRPVLYATYIAIL